MVATGRVDLSAANTTLNAGRASEFSHTRPSAVLPAKVGHWRKSLACASEGVCKGWGVLSCRACPVASAAQQRAPGPE